MCSFGGVTSAIAMPQKDSWKLREEVWGLITSYSQTLKYRKCISQEARTSLLMGIVIPFSQVALLYGGKNAEFC